MSRSAMRTFLAAALVLCLAQPVLAEWKFVVMADSRGSTNGVNVAELTTIVSRVNAENADLVLFGGDAVTGSATDATMSSQMDTWLGVMGNLTAPWYWTPGNHEIQSSTAETVLRGKVIMPLNGPAGDEEMTYSFTHNNAHFVMLNSDNYGQQHHVDRPWLAADLAGNSQPHVFVMTHEPAYPAGPHIGSSLDAYASERDDLWSIMDGGGVGMFFAGHEHLYQRTSHAGIEQVITGTCGAPISTGYANTTAAYEYVVVTINGYDVHAEAKNDAGVTFDAWSYTVPEPVSLGLLLLGLPLLRRRRR